MARHKRTGTRSWAVGTSSRCGKRAADDEHLAADHQGRPAPEVRGLRQLRQGPLGSIGPTGAHLDVASRAALPGRSRRHPGGGVSSAPRQWEARGARRALPACAGRMQPTCGQGERCKPLQPGRRTGIASSQAERMLGRHSNDGGNNVAAFHKQLGAPQQTWHRHHKQQGAGPGPVFVMGRASGMAGQRIQRDEQRVPARRHRTPPNSQAPAAAPQEDTKQRIGRVSRAATPAEATDIGEPAGSTLRLAKNPAAHRRLQARTTSQARQPTSNRRREQGDTRNQAQRRRKVAISNRHRQTLANH